MFGQRLHDLRTENGYTQETLGEKLGVSPKTIGTWERGTREPPMKAIDTLAKLFDVSSDYLLGRSDSRHYYDLTNKEESDLCKILNNSVIPLLYEYYYDDKKKVYSTLNIALKDLNYSIVDMKTRRLYVEEKDSSET